MSGKKLAKFRFGKSPFMLGSIAGLSAIAGDFVWSGAEILNQMGIVDIIFGVHVFLMILFPTCFALIVYAMRLYFLKGYVRGEIRLEGKHLARERKVK